MSNFLALTFKKRTVFDININADDGSVKQLSIEDNDVVEIDYVKVNELSNQEATLETVKGLIVGIFSNDENNLCIKLDMSEQYKSDIRTITNIRDIRKVIITTDNDLSNDNETSVNDTIDETLTNDDEILVNGGDNNDL